MAAMQIKFQLADAVNAPAELSKGPEKAVESVLPEALLMFAHKAGKAAHGGQKDFVGNAGLAIVGPGVQGRLKGEAQFDIAAL